MFGGLLRVKRGFLTEVGVFDLGDVDVHVNAVKERAREFFAIGVDLGLSAGTFVGGVAEVAAGAGVHGGDEHEVGGVGGFGAGAGDGDFLVFERLAEGFEDRAGEFGDFVEKEDAEVGEGDFAGCGVIAAADDGDGRGGVVRGAEGASGDDAVGFAGDGVELGDGDLFFGRGRREKAQGGASEEGFAGARRAGDEEVVVAGDGDGEGALGEGLATDVVEKGAFGICFCIFHNSLRRVDDWVFALEVKEEFAEVFDADELDAGDEGGLGEVF